jgi:hypothetical protein
LLCVHYSIASLYILVTAHLAPNCLGLRIRALIGLSLTHMVTNVQVLSVTLSLHVRPNGILVSRQPNAFLGHGSFYMYKAGAVLCGQAARLAEHRVHDVSR